MDSLWFSFFLREVKWLIMVVGRGCSRSFPKDVILLFVPEGFHGVFQFFFFFFFPRVLFVLALQDLWRARLCLWTLQTP